MGTFQLLREYGRDYYGSHVVFNIPSWCLQSEGCKDVCVTHLRCACLQMDECLTLIFSFSMFRGSSSRQWGGVGQSSGGSRSRRGRFRLRHWLSWPKLCCFIAGGYKVRSSVTSVTYHVLVVHRSCNHSYLAVIVFLHFQVKYFNTTWLTLPVVFILLFKCL